MPPTNQPNASEDEPDDERRTFLKTIGGTAAAATTLAGTVSAEQTGADTVPLTHGVAAGDVTATTAVVWARAADEGVLHVEFSVDDSFDSAREQRTTVDSTTDYTGTIRLSGLQSGTRYHYRAWATNRNESASDAPASAPTGTFVTPPKETDAAPVTFAWTGDTWGYGTNPIEPPFTGLQTIADLDPEFFLYLGDTIYADADTPAGKITDNTPPGEALDIYRGKYKEMRDPPAEIADRSNLMRLLESTSVYTVWDDHEVINNFAGPIEPLMPEGRRAFEEYWPLDRGGRGKGYEHRLYDSFRWGEHMELFILDTRQYRDPKSTSIRRRYSVRSNSPG